MLKKIILYIVGFIAVVIVLFLLYWNLGGEHASRVGHDFGVYPTFIAEVSRQPKVGESAAPANADMVVSDNPLAMGATEPVSPTGSGYDDLEGTLINYEYVGFGGFYLQIKDRVIKWKGFVGGFKDIISEVDPQVSKIAEDIYLLSWAVSGDNGDNVLMNFQDMTVFGHLSQGAPIDMISGSIHCVNQPECLEPEGDSMEGARFIAGLLWNAVRMRVPITDVTLGVAGEADYEGQAALLGKQFVYETDTETITVNFYDAQQSDALKDVAYEDLDPGLHRVNATIVADGIYYISWRAGFGDQHLIYNSHNNKVYDHIADDGTRGEQIYDAISLK